MGDGVGDAGAGRAFHRPADDDASPLFAASGKKMNLAQIDFAAASRSKCSSFMPTPK
ncbi:MAG: hypothetical protein K2Y27_26185 [Xanthobacteraceae bacterium]|nr:hypothetical protein [Xanthobacteraceae bacterium]